MTELRRNTHGSVVGANTISVKKRGRELGGFARFWLLPVESKDFLNE